MTDGDIGIALLRKGVSVHKWIRNQAAVRVRGRRAIPDRRSWFGASRPDQGRDQENVVTDFAELHWVSTAGARAGGRCPLLDAVIRRLTTPACRPTCCV